MIIKKIRKYLCARKNLRIIIDLLGAIAVWWGVWGLLDIYIFPGKEILSYLVSIIFGFILLIIDGNGLDDLK